FHLLDRERKIVLIEFDPMSGSINMSETASNKLDGDELVAALDWLGVADLLLLSDGNQMYIGQILSGELHTEEFFSIDRDVLGFDRMGRGDWRFEGDEDEARALSCIFDDTLSPRLTIGNRAQIAVTD